MFDNQPDEGAENFDSQPYEGAEEVNSQPDEGISTEENAQEGNLFNPNEAPDLNDIPEEYRPLIEERIAQLNNSHKSMLSDYTRKTQELAELRRTLEGMQQEPPEEPGEQSNDLYDYDDLPPKQQQAIDMIKQIAESVVSDRLTPYEQEREDRELDVYFDGLVNTYSDFKEHLPEIADTFEQTGEDPELIYLRIASQKQYQRGIDAAAKNRQERQAATVGRSTTGVSTVTNKAPQSIREAWQQAEAEGV